MDWEFISSGTSWTHSHITVKAAGTSSYFLKRLAHESEYSAAITTGDCAEGGAPRVCCVNDTVPDVFKISGFDTILHVCDTRQEALDALA